MASFGHQTYTIGNRTVYLKWIKTNHKDIRIVNPGGKNVYDYAVTNNLYGINGTFYYTEMDSCPDGYQAYNVHKIAAYNSDPGNSNIASVRNHGLINRGPAGFMFCQYHLSAEIPYIVYSDVLNGSLASYSTYTLDMKNIRWAIGGVSLHLDMNFSTADSYYNYINTNEPLWANWTRSAPRSAIFYIGGSSVGENIVLLSVFSENKSYSADNPTSTMNSSSTGVTPYQLRTLIKDVFPNATTHGIMLDGGSSAGIAYKNTSGTVGAYVASSGLSVPSPANTMIVTPM